MNPSKKARETKRKEIWATADAPYLDIVYKLVQYGDRPIRKLSTGKTNVAGNKQVFRRTDGRGRFVEDKVFLVW